jgi:GNAT superfamily N-acetyltransferase
VADSGDITIRGYQPADEDGVLRVLTDSFLEFPPTQVTVGTDAGARERLARMNALFLAPGARPHVVVAARDGRIVGAMTWADEPDCRHFSAREALAYARIVGTRLLRSMRLFVRVERAHPRTPHRHLPVIGIDPAQQRQGIGGRLMAEFVRGCDEAGLDGYLETVAYADPGRPSHQKLYEHFGFVVEKQLPMVEEWSMITMRRPPSSSGTS